MFRAEDILARLRVQPFRPLRIIGSEGQQFAIHHRDLVGRHDLTIGFPRADHPTIYDRQIRLALVQVVALEDLPTSFATKNGQQ